MCVNSVCYICVLKFGIGRLIRLSCMFMMFVWLSVVSVLLLIIGLMIVML